MNGVPLLGEHRMFCRFAPALTLYAADHATSLIALNATALDALTSRPRKARREPDTAQAAQWAVETGLMTPKSADLFKPEKSVTRWKAIRSWKRVTNQNT